MHILLPLLLQGILAALVTVLVRPIAIFESDVPHFRTAGQTPVVAL